MFLLFGNFMHILLESTLSTRVHRCNNFLSQIHAAMIVFTWSPLSSLCAACMCSVPWFSLWLTYYQTEIRRGVWFGFVDRFALEIQTAFISVLYPEPLCFALVATSRLTCLPFSYLLYTLAPRLVSGGTPWALKHLTLILCVPHRKLLGGLGM